MVCVILKKNTIILANAVGMAIASLVLPALVTNVGEMWIGASISASVFYATRVTHTLDCMNIVLVGCLSDHGLCYPNPVYTQGPQDAAFTYGAQT